MTTSFETGFDWNRRPTTAAPIAMPRLVRPASGAGDAAAILQRFESDLANDANLAPLPSLAPIWLEDVYSLVQKGQPADAIDVLFEHVDELLVTENFEICDDLLRAIDLNRLDTNLIVAALSITLKASDRLSYRTRLFQKARLRLEALAPTRVDRLLNGLR